MAQHLKDKLTHAFNGQGSKVIKVSEMLGHFNQLTDAHLGFMHRTLVRSANPCQKFDGSKLAEVLIEREDGTLGLYAEGKGKVGEHNAYFHSETLLRVFHAALDRTLVPPGFSDLRDKVVELSIKAYHASTCHLGKLAQGHLRPVKHPELLRK
jgi:hypothetical protein